MHLHLYAEQSEQLRGWKFQFILYSYVAYIKHTNSITWVDGRLYREREKGWCILIGVPLIDNIDSDQVGIDVWCNQS
jgi:hypothetical protein